MVIVKILKRKDASSVLVAVVLAMIVGQALSLMASDLATKLSGLGQEQGQFNFGPPDGDWQHIYLYPAVWAALQILFLEILAWLTIIVGAAFRQVPKKKK